MITIVAANEIRSMKRTMPVSGPAALPSDFDASPWCRSPSRVAVRRIMPIKTPMTEAPPGDEAAQQRRRELEAAAAKYTEQLKSAGLRKGRPDPH